VPLFLLASASSSAAPPSGAPAWRVVAGNLAAGAVSGCAVEAALYPIDTIKTRMQAAIGGGGFSAMFANGSKSLYAGCFQNLVGVAPASAIFISVYEPMKRWVEARVTPEQRYLGPIAGGAAAGLASSIVRVPTEVIKSRLQTGEVKGAIAAIRSIISTQGVKGLYAGYGAFLLRDLPFDAIEFVAYEQGKRAVEGMLKRECHVHETSVIGAFAGGWVESCFLLLPVAS
jgi:solute carrier family 25 S-adenosylmethionine transporter 26